MFHSATTHNLNAQRHREQERTAAAVRHMPSRRGATGGGVTVNVLTMGAGNSLGTLGATEYFGLIGQVGLSIDAVPTAVPTAIDTVYSDGLSAALLNGALVWAATRVHLDTDDDDVPDAFFFDKIITLPEDVQFISYESYDVPITGGGGATAKVYLPGLA